MTTTKDTKLKPGPLWTAVRQDQVHVVWVHHRPNKAVRRAQDAFAGSQVEFRPGRFVTAERLARALARVLG